MYKLMHGTFKCHAERASCGHVIIIQRYGIWNFFILYYTSDSKKFKHHVTQLYPATCHGLLLTI